MGWHLLSRSLNPRRIYKHSILTGGHKEDIMAQALREKIALPPAGPGEFIMEAGPSTGAISRLAEQQMAERARDAELRYAGALAPPPPQDLQQEYEQKLARRQALFRKAAEHRVPPEELMRRLKIEGLEDLQMPQTELPARAKRQIIKDVVGKPRYADTGEEVFPEVRKPPEAKTGTPTQLAKLIEERTALSTSGVPDSDPRIKAYDSRISGADIDIEALTPEEIDVMGAHFNLTGQMPSVGRGKQSTKARLQIIKSATRQALARDPLAPPEQPDKTPMDAALGMLGSQTDTKAIQGSLNFLERQLGAMGSFVANMESQVSKVKELSKDLKTFDTRFLNIPVRALRSRLVGSPLQSKYDMYLSEIESEIGKLATGSAASISELSVGAQERWAKIHDKNLSLDDMLSLLEETVHAARMREDSVQKQLDKTRGKMRRSTDTRTRATDNTSNQKTVINPNTGQAETWDLVTGQRVR